MLTPNLQASTSLCDLYLLCPGHGTLLGYKHPHAPRGTFPNSRSFWNLQSPSAW